MLIQTTCARRDARWRDQSTKQQASKLPPPPRLRRASQRSAKDQAPRATEHRTLLRLSPDALQNQARQNCAGSETDAPRHNGSRVHSRSVWSAVLEHRFFFLSTDHRNSGGKPPHSKRWREVFYPSPSDAPGSLKAFRPIVWHALERLSTPLHASRQGRASVPPSPKSHP